MRTMRCIVKTAAGAGNLREEVRPLPRIGERELLVKVRAAAVCGTDVHIMDWNDWAEKRVRPGVVIGHEFAGEVVEAGGAVTSVRVGDIVAAETHIPCETCALCRDGNGHVCRSTKLVGVNRDGCFAEYIALPEKNALLCDPNLPIEVSALMEPLGVAVHAAMEFPLAGKIVAVTGCGPIGLMAVGIAKLLGAKQVLAVEINPARAEAALKMGATDLVNPVEGDAAARAMELTGGEGVDAVLEFSGSVAALKSAISYCKPEARIAAAGLPSKPMEFNLSEFVYRGLCLKGIAGRLLYRTWEQARGLLRAGLDISPVITHVWPMSRWEEALTLMKEGRCGKIILKPDWND